MTYKDYKEQHRIADDLGGSLRIDYERLLELYNDLGEGIRSIELPDIPVGGRLDDTTKRELDRKLFNIKTDVGNIQWACQDMAMKVFNGK